jgi:hypothetical protein
MFPRGRLFRPFESSEAFQRDLPGRGSGLRASEQSFSSFDKNLRANLQEFMRHFNISCTSYFNRQYKRAGHLYQGRYESFLIDGDSYLQEVSRYIHLNPVRVEVHGLQDGIMRMPCNLLLQLIPSHQPLVQGCTSWNEKYSPRFMI